MKKIYAIRDRVADELVGLRMYALMCFRTNEEAARYFADAINDTSSILNKHPADYELIHVGMVNEKGFLATQDGVPVQSEPIVIITGDALMAIQQPTLLKDA